MERKALAFLAVLSLVFGVVATAGAQESADGVREGRTFTAVEGLIELQEVIELPVNADGKMISVIVKLDEAAAVNYTGGVNGLSATAGLSAGASEFQDYIAYLDTKHATFSRDLSSVAPSATVVHSYTTIIGGVSVVLSPNDLNALKSMKGVVAIYEDRLEQLDTDTTPEFIRADRLWKALGGQEVAGEGIIVANIDSGIWPEHPSVSDPDPFGNAYPAPPTVPGSNGDISTTGPCDFGDTAFNPADAAFACNNKLIGAYDFTDTYKLVLGLIPTEFDSARDSNGHGTHTLTTAAGNGGVDVTLLGFSRGEVSGIAPRAHVIAYKGCGLDGCFGSDTAAATAQAILDEVDVINYSISGGSSPYTDGTSLAFLDAYNAGVLVTPSAGNSGPGADTVAHREPWTMTVGASTSDRHFIGSVTLTSTSAGPLTVSGASVTDGIAASTPVVFAGDFGDALCLTPFAPGTFSGEIVICDRGVIARVTKSFNVSEGGASGLLLVNTAPLGLATDNHFIPSLHLEDVDGAAVKAYEAGETGVEATLTPGLATAVPGDVMAAFSSRGGPAETLGISKPDVTAPGVQILAGNTPMPETPDGGLPGELFQSIQGTSMSAPHAAGAAAIVLAANPGWGPGQVKSALMLTGLRSVKKEDGTTNGDAFDYGSGRIHPPRAAQADLSIWDTGASFVALEDELWNANYPSVFMPNMPGIMSVDRTAYSETGKKVVWHLKARSPRDVRISVPSAIFVPAGGSATFSIDVDASRVPIGATRFSTLQFMNSKTGEALRMPITLVRGEAAVTIDKTCTPRGSNVNDRVDCTITLENTSSTAADFAGWDEIPDNFVLNKTSVVGGTAPANNLVTYMGTLPATLSPTVGVAVDNFASPAGYLPLTLFSPTDVGATDESIANFGVPTFDYAGESYDTIGIVSNGYVVIGGGTGADVDFINSALPGAALPNNVLAPFWTDLNPAAGGTVWVETLTDGFDSWTVVEWDAVENFGDGLPNTAQVWIGWNTDFDPSQDISFTYATVTGGDGGFLTVGAENKFGDSGGMTYFDGAGTPPAPSFGGGSAACDAAWPAAPCYEVDVTGAAGAPGGTHTVTYRLKAVTKGAYWNFAKVESPLFDGTAVGAFRGAVR